jgi:hypothetical protein
VFRIQSAGHNNFDLNQFRIIYIELFFVTVITYPDALFSLLYPSLKDSGKVIPGDGSDEPFPLSWARERPASLRKKFAFAGGEVRRIGRVANDLNPLQNQVLLN